jgi:hypothetical protein
MAASSRASRVIDDDVVTDIAPDLLRDVILPSELLASDECSADYRRLYAQRVEEAIATDHEDLRRALGEGRFAALVRNLLATLPTAGDVARAARAFAAFLRAEAEHDPALFVARAVALRRPGVLGLRPGLVPIRALGSRTTSRPRAQITRRAS